MKSADEREPALMVDKAQPGDAAKAAEFARALGEPIGCRMCGHPDRGVGKEEHSAMRVNRFKGTTAKRRADRAFHTSPNHKIARRVERNGDLLTYMHPTKGPRSRRWPRTMPTFASKFDMAVIISVKLALRNGGLRTRVV